MDFNAFIQKCKDKYFKYGVTFVGISVWGDTLSIYLQRPEGIPSHPDSIRVGIEDDEQGVFCYAHYKANMPFNEHEVFYYLDEWFSNGAYDEYIGKFND